MTSIKTMKKKLYDDMDVIEQPAVAILASNDVNRPKTSTKADLSITCCGRIKINAPLLYMIGYGQLALTSIILILTIAHFARFSPLTGQMPAIVATIVSGVVLGVLSTALLFVGVRRKLTYLLKIHYIVLAIASCLLFMSFVFAFTSIYGEFDESYFYGERKPPVVVALGVVWGLASPLSVVAGFVIRRFYKIVQDENCALKRSLRNTNANGGDNSWNTATENESPIATHAQQISASSPMNGSVILSKIFNGHQNVESEVTPEAFCAIVKEQPFETSESLKEGRRTSASDVDDDRYVESYEDICDNDGVKGDKLTYEQICDLETAAEQVNTTDSATTDHETRQENV